MVSKVQQREPCVDCSVETEMAWNCLLVIKNEDHFDANYYEDIQLTPVKKEEDDQSPKNCALLEESVDNLRIKNSRIKMKLLWDDPRR